MMAIVMLLVLASGAFADEYTPVDWVEVTEDGRIKMKLGFSMSAGCITLSATINGVRYSTVSSKWQRRGEDSEWIDVPGTEKSGQMCGWIPDMPGEYRLVADIEVDGVLRKYASGNTIVVAGDPEAEEEESQETDESAAEETGDETAVETVTWGFLKSRATR